MLHVNVTCISRMSNIVIIFHETNLMSHPVAYVISNISHVTSCGHMSHATAISSQRDIYVFSKTDIIITYQGPFMTEDNLNWRPIRTENSIAFNKLLLTKEEEPEE